MDINARRLREVEQWVGQYGGHFGDGLFGRGGGREQATTGVARIEVSAMTEKESGTPRYARVELHADRAAFVAREMFAVKRTTGTCSARTWC
jgi:hypothetical protein